MVKHLIQFEQFANKFAPELLLSMKGATDVEIKQLEKLSKVSLSEEYYEYLKLMGSKNSELKIFRDAKYEINHLIKVYEEEQDLADNLSPSKIILIASDGDSISSAFASCSDVSPSIYTGESLVPHKPYSKNINNLLCRTVFLEKVIAKPLYSDQFVISEFQNPLSKVIVTAKNTGLQILDFSDNYSVCAMNSSIILYSESFDSSNCWLKVASNSLDDIQSLQKDFCKK
jgi:hypothetical protein